MTSPLTAPGVAETNRRATSPRRPRDQAAPRDGRDRVNAEPQGIGYMQRPFVHGTPSQQSLLIEQS